MSPAVLTGVICQKRREDTELFERFLKEYMNVSSYAGINPRVSFRGVYRYILGPEPTLTYGPTIEGDPTGHQITNLSNPKPTNKKSPINVYIYMYRYIQYTYVDTYIMNV